MTDKTEEDWGQDVKDLYSKLGNLNLKTVRILCYGDLNKGKT